MDCDRSAFYIAHNIVYMGKKGTIVIRVQFNNLKSMHQAEFKTISSSVVQLTGKKIPKNTNGFKVYRLNGDLLGDYSEYTEIIKEVEQGLQFGKKTGN